MQTHSMGKDPTAGGQTQARERQPVGTGDALGWVGSLPKRGRKQAQHR